MSDLKQYTLDVEVTDAIMHDANSTVNVAFSLAALGKDEEDVKSLTVEFYSRSGFVTNMVNGHFTLSRSGSASTPGAIRMVKVSNITEVAEPLTELAVPFVKLLALSEAVAAIAPDMDISPDGTLISARALLKEQKTLLDAYATASIKSLGVPLGADPDFFKPQTKAEKRAAAKAAKDQKVVDNLTLVTTETVAPESVTAETADAENLETPTEPFVMEEAEVAKVEGTKEEPQA